MPAPASFAAGGIRIRILIALTLAALAAGAAVPAFAEGTTHTVEATNFAWTPDALTVDAGDSVAFVLRDGVHNWVSDDGLGSCDLPCTRTFDTPGTYAYRCGFHPSMTGAIRVRAADSPDLRFGAVGAAQEVRPDGPGAVDDAQTVRIRYQLVNDGTAAAGASVVRAEAFLNGAWTRVGDAPHGALAAGATEEGAIDWRSDGVSVGRFQVRLTADATGLVAEAFEDNNRATTRAVFLADTLVGVHASLP